MPFKEIKFGTELHGRILRGIQERARMSQRKMAERYDEWDRAEKRMVAYVPAKDAERKAKRQSEVSEFTQIEIPFIYAMALTAHTYHTSVFLSRSPVLQVQGRHGEAQQQVLAQEALLNYQVQVGGMMPVYYTWLLDTHKYGLGVVGTHWDKELIQVSRIVDQPVVQDGITLPDRTKKVRQVIRQTGYEGNRTFNVRPFDWLPDPRVALQNFQAGEFCGRLTRISWNDFVKGLNAGNYFNREPVERGAQTTSHGDLASGFGESGDNPALVEKSKQEEVLFNKESTRDKNMLNVLEMHIEIIPKDWGLGESDFPEIWSFTVVNDRVIIGAQPLGLLHNSFPFEALEAEIDGYGFNSRGMFEIGEPLAQSMDWLANSHFYNVQKALNNEFVVDPTAVVMKDFLDPRPGKMIRLRPAAYGKDVRTVIHQLPQVDYTRTHLQDMRVIEGLMQKVFGINESLLGAVNPSGRKTATEVRSSTTFGINRLKTQAEWFSATGWSRLTQMFVQNNQQLYEAEMQFRIAGNNIVGDPFVNVSPESISGFYDFVPVDGTLPIDRFAQASLWKEIFAQIRNMPPEVQGGYDWGAVFGWMAKLAGLKNIDMFRKQQLPQVNAQPDEQIQQQVQAGNLVPLSEAQNGRSTGRVEDGTGPLAGAPRIGGVGPTG